MKCKTIIDKMRDEEVLIYLHAPNSLSEEIEALVTDRSYELIGYTLLKNGEKRIVKLAPADVHCFAVEGDRVYALTDGEKLQIRQRLYVLEGQLGEGFVRINQSCIANVRKIEKFDASLGGALLVTFKNGYREYVSRRRLKKVEERIGFRL